MGWHGGTSSDLSFPCELVWVEGRREDGVSVARSSYWQVAALSLHPGVTAQVLVRSVPAATTALCTAADTLPQRALA